MSPDDERPAARMRNLNGQAARERAALAEMLTEARRRLRPGHLASQAGDRITDLVLDGVDKGKTVARQHPLKALGLAAAVGAILARRPLFHVVLRVVDTGWRQFCTRQQREFTEEREN